MQRRTFYILIASLLSAIFIHFILCALFFHDKGIQGIIIGRLKICIAIAILVYETVSAKRIFQRIAFSLFPLVAIGFGLKIMHWPFGLLIFLVSLIGIFVVLFVNAIKSKINRTDKIVLLVYPLSEFIVMICKIYHLPPIWSTFHFFVLGLIGIYLWFRISNKGLI